MTLGMLEQSENRRMALLLPRLHLTHQKVFVGAFANLSFISIEQVDHRNLSRPADHGTCAFISAHPGLEPQ